MKSTPLQELVAEVGTYRLAKMLGIKHPSIHTWLRTGQVPAERVLAVEKATGVPRYRLRPDLYPPDEYRT